MSGYSEMIGSFIRTGNYPIEANYVFESEEALNNYQVHPEHVKVAAFVRSITCNRMCMDFE